MKQLPDEAALRAKPTTDLLMLWYVIMDGTGFKEYFRATNEERAAFFVRLGAEIDARIPTRRS